METNINNILDLDVFHYLFANYLSDRLSWLRNVHPLWRDVIDSIKNDDKKTALSIFVESDQMIQYAKENSILIKLEPLIKNMEKLKNIDPKSLFLRPFDLIDPIFVCKFISTQPADKIIQFLELIKNQPGFGHLIKKNQKWRKILIIILFSGNDQLFDWFDDNFEMFDLHLDKLPDKVNFFELSRNDYMRFPIAQMNRTLKRYPSVLHQTNAIYPYLVDFEYSSVQDLIDYQIIVPNNLIVSFVNGVLDSSQYLVHVSDEEFMDTYHKLFLISTLNENKLNTNFLQLAIVRQNKKQIKFFAQFDGICLNFLRINWKIKLPLFDQKMIEFVIKQLGCHDCESEFFNFLLCFDLIFDNSLPDFIIKRICSLSYHKYVIKLINYRKLIYFLIDNNKHDIIFESRIIPDSQRSAKLFYQEFMKRYFNQIDSIQDPIIKKQCIFLVIWLNCHWYCFDEEPRHIDFKKNFCVMLAQTPFFCSFDKNVDQNGSKKFVSFKAFDQLLTIMGDHLICLPDSWKICSTNIDFILNHFEISPDIVKNQFYFYSVKLIEHCFHLFSFSDFVDLTSHLFALDRNHKVHFEVILWLRDHQFYPRTEQLWEHLMLHYLNNNKLIEFCNHHSKLIDNPINLLFTFEDDVFVNLTISFEHIRIMHQSKLFNVDDIHKLCRFLDIDPFVLS